MIIQIRKDSKIRAEYLEFNQKFNRKMHDSSRKKFFHIK